MLLLKKIHVRNSILCTEGVKRMIFTRGAVCSPRVLQSTEGKNHSLPRSIYYFLHDPTILIEKSRKFVNYHKHFLAPLMKTVIFVLTSGRKVTLFRTLTVAPSVGMFSKLPTNPTKPIIVPSP
jgi:hypothetical protein